MNTKGVLGDVMGSLRCRALQVNSALLADAGARYRRVSVRLKPDTTDRSVRLKPDTTDTSQRPRTSGRDASNSRDTRVKITVT